MRSIYLSCTGAEIASVCPRIVGKINCQSCALQRLQLHAVQFSSGFPQCWGCTHAILRCLCKMWLAIYLCLRHSAPCDIFRFFLSLKIWQLELRRRYVNIWSKLMERELGFKKCYHKYMFCRVNLEMLLAHIFCSIHRGCAVGCCYFLRIWHNDWRCRYVRIRNKPMQCAMRSIVLLADIFP